MVRGGLRESARGGERGGEVGRGGERGAEESDDMITYGTSRGGRAGLLCIMLGLTRREYIPRLPGTAAMLSQ